MAYNKIIYKGDTLIDLTKDTVTPETLMKGATAHGKNGEPIVGTATGGGANLIEHTFTKNGTYDNTNVESTKIVRETFDIKAAFESNEKSFKLTKFKAEDKDAFLSTGQIAFIDLSGNYIPEIGPVHLSDLIQEQGEYLNGAFYFVGLDMGIELYFVNDGPATNDFLINEWEFPSELSFSSGCIYGVVWENIFDGLPETVSPAFEVEMPGGPFDGFSKVTVNVHTPPGEWGKYVAPDGLVFTYGFSEDGKDLYVMGTGALTCSDFYCTDAPWKNNEKIETVERIIIGSGITDYPWYAFHQDLIVTKN